MTMDEFHYCREELREEENNSSVSEVEQGELIDCSSEEPSGVKTNEYFIDEEYLSQVCDLLTDEQKLAQKEEAIKLKADGNSLFTGKLYREAAKIYTEALRVRPTIYKDLGAILYSNRAACFSKMDLYEEAIADCTKSIELDESFTKAILRRAELYERKEENYDKALEDFRLVLKHQPNNKMALDRANRLPMMITERNEKMKNEMVGKLKDLGNLFLRPFGLSTDNFQLEEQAGGGYSVKIQK